MLVLDGVFAFLMAMLFTAIFLLGFLRGSGTWSVVLMFFLIVFLAGWAGALWVTPAGPVFLGIFWVPIVAVAFVFAVLLTWLIPRRPPTQKVETISQVEQEEEATRQVFSVFFWVLLIGLAAVIILGYAFERAPA